MAVGCIVYRMGSSVMRDIAGFGRKMPFTAAMVVLGSFGLIGMPLTAGFVSKWFLLLGALEQGWYIIAVVILLSGLMALVYMWRVVECAYFGTSRQSVEGELREAPLSMLIPLGVLSAANLYFGINGTLTGDIVLAAARSLIGVGQ
jgi:multicomponent Na+:H+ antiporter subunit D